MLRGRQAYTFGAPSGDERALDHSSASSDGHVSVQFGTLVVRWPLPGGTHKVKVACGPFTANGVSVRLRVSGFSTLRPFGLGVIIDGQFRRLAVQNLWLDRWIDVSLGLGDLAFRVQNDWDTVVSGTVTEVQLHFTGIVDSSGGSVAIERIELWDEEQDDFALRVASRETTFRRLLQEGDLWTKFEPMSSSLLSLLDGYMRLQSPESEAQADAFMARGDAPSYRAVLHWTFDAPLPAALAELNTYRWSWHGLYPVVVLACSARKSGRLAPLFAARDILNAWLDRSFYVPDEDQKYAWYDHGVGDRLVALTLIWDYGVRLGFDQRFMSRLLDAIARHMQLLGSEAFYACHQRTRYHNHAVFQDIWLMFAALAVPEIAGARRYFEIAAARVSDQLEKLLVRDGQYAVLIENSVSYHLGFQWMVELVDNLMSLGQLPSLVPELAAGMKRFTSLARYPDGRLPGIGDSPRTANPRRTDATARKPYAKPSAHALTRAGHVIVRGNHAGSPYMLTVSATSLGETHKHEDHLSFTLYLDGIEWLIDPSFHSYEPTLPLPQYLRRAVAHNAVVLPARTYSIAPGNAWIDAVQAGSEVSIRGVHTAYAHLRVSRRIEARLDCLALDFLDEVTSAGSDLPERGYLMLQCGDGVEVTCDGTRLLLRHPASEFHLAIELPTARCRTFFDTTDRGEPRGVTGLGFTENGPITSIECELIDLSSVRWSIQAVR